MEQLLPLNEPAEKRNDEAEDQAGGEREVNCCVLVAPHEIARKLPGLEWEPVADKEE